MRFSVTGLIILSTILFSCKHGAKEMILGSWQGTKLENADMDSFFMQSQNYIDTLGKNNSARTNWELYGVTNVDSLRHVLQLQHDSAKAMQMDAVKRTVFTFKKENVAIVAFNDGLDTSRWQLENDSLLVMEELTGNEKGTKTKMEIIALNEKELKLKFKQENSSSTVTFVKSQK